MIDLLALRWFWEKSAYRGEMSKSSIASKCIVPHCLHLCLLSASVDIVAHLIGTWL